MSEPLIAPRIVVQNQYWLALVAALSLVGMGVSLFGHLAKMHVETGNYLLPRMKIVVYACFIFGFGLTIQTTVGTALNTWIRQDFVSCGVNFLVGGTFAFLSRTMLYLYFVLRAQIAFKGSQYAFSDRGSLIRQVVVILVGISWFLVIMPTLQIDTKKNTCEFANYAGAWLLITDLGLNVYCVKIFIGRLLQASRDLMGSKGMMNLKERKMIDLSVKLAWLSLWTCLGTLISIVFGWMLTNLSATFTIIDVLINYTCVLLSFKFYDHLFDRYCSCVNRVAVCIFPELAGSTPTRHGSIASVTLSQSKQSGGASPVSST